MLKACRISSGQLVDPEHPDEQINAGSDRQMNPSPIKQTLKSITNQPRKIQIHFRPDLFLSSNVVQVCSSAHFLYVLFIYFQCSSENIHVFLCTVGLVLSLVVVLFRR